MPDAVPKVLIINDGKGKSQSFTAILEASVSTNTDNTGFWQASAYGSTEQEARANLSAALQRIVETATAAQNGGEE